MASAQSGGSSTLYVFPSRRKAGGDAGGDAYRGEWLRLPWHRRHAPWVPPLVIWGKSNFMLCPKKPFFLYKSMLSRPSDLSNEFVKDIPQRSHVHLSLDPPQLPIYPEI